MRVKLKYPWFSPSEITANKDINLSVSGRYWPAGENDMPDELYDFLPKSAKILSISSEPAKVSEKGKSLKDFDELRANSDATSDLLNKFNSEGKEKL